jgi:tartrate dehydrogenase/decarboxylase/D-malate dehydrogenase
VLKYAFRAGAKPARQHLTVATKSNGIAISMPWWDGRADAVGRAYPAVTVDKQHIDILCARFVLQPTRFDVVVAPTCLATSCPTWGRPPPAPLGWHRRPT